MARAYRLVQARFVSRAFDGEGARLYGGRWNSKGTPMVYTSHSLSLAALELLVHLNSRQVLEERYRYLVIEFSGKLCRQVNELFKLPKDWAAEPAPESTKRIGDRWVREGKSAVLAVPSVVVKDEQNYLLNPRHPAFSDIRISKPKRFQFDPRLAA